MVTLRRSAARLALSHGVSDMIAMLEPELTALGRTITASAADAAEITRLGEGLNAFNANAAPIAAFSQSQIFQNAHGAVAISGQPPNSPGTYRRANRQYTKLADPIGPREDPPSRNVNVSPGNLPSPRPSSSQRSSMTAPGASPPTKATPTPRVIDSNGNFVASRTDNSGIKLNRCIANHYTYRRRGRIAISCDDDMRYATVPPVPNRWRNPAKAMPERNSSARCGGP